MFQTELVEKIKTYILYSVTFSSNCAVYEIMWKYIVEPERLHGDMVRAHCMLDN
jgi:hypothetical protein